MNITIRILSNYKDKLWIFFTLLSAVIIGTGIVNDKWLYTGILLIPLLMYLSIKKPFIFPFGLYVMLLPFEPLLMIKGATEAATYAKLLGILTISVMLFTGVFEKKLRWPGTPALLWLALISYCLLTAFWASDPHKTLSIYTFQTLSGLFFLYCVVSSYEINRKDLQIIKLFVFLGGITSVLYALWDTGWATESRMSIGQSNANAFAFSLLIPISISIEYILESESKVMKSIFLCFFAMLVYSILITGSRGASLGFAVVVISFILYSKEKVLLSSIIVVVLMILFFFTPDFFFERWGRATESGGANRLYIWIIALHALTKYWPIGIGFNNFPLAFNEFGHHYTALGAVGYGSHSLYIGLFVELGIVGMVLLVVVIVAHYRCIKNHPASKLEAVMLKASFWSLLIHSAFGDTFKTKVLWLLWMMIVMHKNTIRSEIPRHI